MKAEPLQRKGPSHNASPPRSHMPEGVTAVKRAHHSALPLRGGDGAVECISPTPKEGAGGGVGGVGGVHLIRRLRREALRAGLFVCYECREDRCGYCIGVPCMCECPIPETEPEYSI